MEVDGLELKSINEDNNATTLRVQKPKRVLHFSDGVMEDFSDCEDECDSAMKTSEERIHTKHLTWGPYMRLKANKVGNNVLAGIDYVGGGLASFLGITPSEAELDAAKRGLTVEEKPDEEHCSTWNPVPNDTVVSAEVKNSPRSRSKYT